MFILGNLGPNGAALQIAHGCFLSRISLLNLCAHCIWQWRVPGVVLGQLRISCRVTARFHVIKPHCVEAALRGKL